MQSIDLIKTLSQHYRIDLVIGALIELLGNIKGLEKLDATEINNLKVKTIQLLSGRENLQKLEKRIADYLREKQEEIINVIGDSLLLDLFIKQLRLFNRFSTSIKGLLNSIEERISRMVKLVSYFYIPNSTEEIVEFWKIPREWADETIFRKLFVEDERIQNIINKVWNLVTVYQNVIIIGPPGVGKTALLYRLLMEVARIRNVALLISSDRIGRVHEDLGIILFIDDLPQQIRNPQALLGVRGLIATARDYEWYDMINNYPEIKHNFLELRLDKGSSKFLREILIRLLSQYKIPYEENAVSVVVDKAQGAPIYLYQLVKDLLVMRNSSPDIVLNIGIAESIPAGMYEYVGELLRTAIADKPGGKSMITALKCISMVENKSINSTHLALLYEELCRKLGEKPSWDLYDDIHQLMNYNPNNLTLTFPHDIWIDVLHGKSRIIASLINFIDSKIPDTEKMEILKKTAEKTWLKIYEDIVFLMRKSLVKKEDVERALVVAKTLQEMNLGIHLIGLDDIKHLMHKIGHKDTNAKLSPLS